MQYMNIVFMPMHLHMGILVYQFSFMNQKQLQPLLEIRHLSECTKMALYKMIPPQNIIPLI